MKVSPMLVLFSRSCDSLFSQSLLQLRLSDRDGTGDLVGMPNLLPSYRVAVLKVSTT